MREPCSRWCSGLLPAATHLRAVGTAADMKAGRRPGRGRRAVEVAALEERPLQEHRGVPSFHGPRHRAACIDLGWDEPRQAGFARAHVESHASVPREPLGGTQRVLHATT